MPEAEALRNSTLHALCNPIVHGWVTDTRPAPPIYCPDCGHIPTSAGAARTLRTWSGSQAGCGDACGTSLEKKGQTWQNALSS
jgi:hypothetical protein